MVIQIENLSKRYDIISQKSGYLTFRDKVVQRITNFSKKRNNHKEFWALKNINLSIKRGEIIGIIGPNGAGKTTLLKILSRITPPSSGKAVIKGRVATLLEVGTAFHSELSGRENLYLNGAILGMKKSEIERSFDDIVDFSGIGKFIDTPVKKYSSGMFVRLAFSVAAHLNPDILFVDEVLSVGDAEFQKKCVGKMESITKNSGRTILFVSHNMGAVSSLCKKCIFLKNGKIYYSGKTEEVIQKYLSSDFRTKTETELNQFSNDGVVCIKSARLISKNHNSLKSISIDQEFGLEINYTIKKSGFSPKPNIHLKNLNGDYIFVSSPENMNLEKTGEYSLIAWIPGNLLNETTYTIDIAFTTIYPFNVHIHLVKVLCFDIINNVNFIALFI